MMSKSYKTRVGMKDGQDEKEEERLVAGTAVTKRKRGEKARRR